MPVLGDLADLGVLLDASLGRDLSKVGGGLLAFAIAIFLRLAVVLLCSLFGDVVRHVSVALYTRLRSDFSVLALALLGRDLAEALMKFHLSASVAGGL